MPQYPAALNSYDHHMVARRGGDTSKTSRIKNPSPPQREKRDLG